MSNIKRITLVFCIIISMNLVIYQLWISKNVLCKTEYSISYQQLNKPIRVVQLSDLHNATFGQDNEKLVLQVSEAEPDLILITGDLVNDKSSDSNTSIATGLIRGLCEIAPVYVSYGNQEVSMTKSYGLNFKELYSEAGATVLDREFLDLEVSGQPIRIGGIYGYCQTVPASFETNRVDEVEYLIDFQDTDNFTILMCHMPVAWITYESLNDYNIDCVFAGHVHGGQIRIPFVGGLYAPDQGWFPGEVAGVYSTNEEEWKSHISAMSSWVKKAGYDTDYYDSICEYEPSYLVLSRGLGNTDWAPRFNNVPEIVVVDFIPKE